VYAKLLVYQFDVDEMGRRHVRSLKGFGGEIRRKEITWKKQA